MAFPSGHRFSSAFDVLEPMLRDALEQAGLTRAGVVRRAYDGGPEDAAAFARLLLPGAGDEELGLAALRLLELHSAAELDAQAAARRYAHLDPMEIMEGVVRGAATRQAQSEAVRTGAELRELDAD